MKSCRRAWNVVARLRRTEVPPNPFAGMGLVGSDGMVKEATYADLVAAVTQADTMGLPSLGTALMVTWEWLQREEHIFTRFELAHYRPRGREREVLIVHPKNGESVWIPLFDPQCPQGAPALRQAHGEAKRRGDEKTPGQPASAQHFRRWRGTVTNKIRRSDTTEFLNLFSMGPKREIVGMPIDFIGEPQAW